MSKRWSEHSTDELVKIANDPQAHRGHRRAAEIELKYRRGGRPANDARGSRSGDAVDRTTIEKG